MPLFFPALVELILKSLALVGAHSCFHHQMKEAAQLVEGKQCLVRIIYKLPINVFVVVLLFFEWTPMTHDCSGAVISKNSSWQQNLEF
jgi:hypothetical protein